MDNDIRVEVRDSDANGRTVGDVELWQIGAGQCVSSQCIVERTAQLPLVAGNEDTHQTTPSNKSRSMGSSTWKGGTAR